MKTLPIVIIIIAFFNVTSFAQSLWQIKTDSANFAVLVSDYETYEFEKAYFSVHEANTNSENELPIESIYNPPVDFGNITFLYSVNHDTLFSGDIIWLSVGEIIFPREFIPADSFTFIQYPFNEPISKEYFTNFYSGESGLFNSKTDSVWLGLKQLNIVEAFSQHPYRIGIFLYKPGSIITLDSVSLHYSDLLEAKWVTFLYVNNPITSVINDNKEIPNKFVLEQNYPNPFNPTTVINYSLAESGITKVIVYDILGNEIETLVNQFQTAGSYNVEFNASYLSSGVYFYRIITTSFSATKKMILLR